MTINRDQALLILNLLGSAQSQVALSRAELDLRDKIFESFPDLQEQYHWIGKAGY
jgi:hypothetical protein